MPQGHPMRVFFSRTRKEEFSQARMLIRFPEKPPILHCHFVFIGCVCGWGGGFVWLVFPPLSVFFSFVSFALVLHSTRRSHNVVRPLGATRSRQEAKDWKIHCAEEVLEITGFCAEEAYKCWKIHDFCAEEA